MAWFFVPHAIAPPPKVNKNHDAEQEESTSIHPCSGVDTHACILDLFAPKYAF